MFSLSLRFLHAQLHITDRYPQQRGQRPHPSQLAALSGEHEASPQQLDQVDQMDLVQVRDEDPCHLCGDLAVLDQLCKGVTVGTEQQPMGVDPDTLPGLYEHVRLGAGQARQSSSHHLTELILFILDVVHH